MDSFDNMPKLPSRGRSAGSALQGIACGNTIRIPPQSLVRNVDVMGIGRSKRPQYITSPDIPGLSGCSNFTEPRILEESSVSRLENMSISNRSEIGISVGHSRTFANAEVSGFVGGIGRARPGQRRAWLPPTSYKFRVEKLIHPCDLASRNKNESFFIMSADRLNRVYIVPLKDRELNILTISDEIQLQSLNDARLVEAPRVGDVVLAMVGQKLPFVRVIVDKLLTGANDHQILVREIDKGRTFTVGWSEVKTVNDKIMEFPVVGYYVELNGLSESSDLILMFDFESKIRTFRKVKMRVDVIRKGQSLDYVVDLKRRDNKKSIVPEILDVSKWQWERILELSIYRNDDDIAGRGEWSDCPKEFYSPFHPYDIYFDVEVVASVKITKESQDYITLYLKPLSEYANGLRRVLESQVERYMRMVQPSPYYPALNEKAFILPPKGQPGAGKWHRMMRFDQVRDLFYAVDAHLFYDIPPSDEGYQYRRVLPEFIRIPKLIMEAALVGHNIKDNKIKDAIEATFTAGAKLSVVMLKLDQDKVEDVSVIRCEELTNALKKIAFAGTDSRTYR